MRKIVVYMIFIGIIFTGCEKTTAPERYERHTELIAEGWLRFRPLELQIDSGEVKEWDTLQVEIGMEPYMVVTGFVVSDSDTVYLCNLGKDSSYTYKERYLIPRDGIMKFLYYNESMDTVEIYRKYIRIWWEKK